MTFNVLIPDSVEQTAVDMLTAEPEIAVTARKMNREETLAAVAEAEGLIIRSSTKADTELIGAASRLKVIVRAGVGVDNVDLAEATRHRVVVMNTPDGNTLATAEHTLGLMLALARHTPQAHQSLLDGKWERKAFMGVGLSGRTLGLVGFGRIGQEVARRALAFGMKVIAYDPYITGPSGAGLEAVQMVDLDTLYAQADFISLHPLLTDETRGMISTESLARMKRGVRIVNAARGALIDDEALAEAIQSGQVAGAAVDVYATEPPAPDHPLIGLEGVVHTPHLAASTVDAQIAVAVQAAEQMIAALLRGDYHNVVNRDVLP